MTQFVSQFESKISPPSSPFAFSFKDLQEALKVFTLDIKEEVMNFMIAKRIAVADLLEEEDRTMREGIWSAVRGVNYKMDETTENEERLDSSMEELVNIEVTQEESTISQNECIGGLEEEKLQVYSKKFFIKDTSFNLEWKLEEVGNEIEKFLKETSSKILRRRKDFAFLFDELKCQVSRGDILIGTAANYDGIRRRLITALQAKDLSILKVGSSSSPYME